MDTSRLKRKSDCEWVLEPDSGMRVQAVLYASQELIRDMDNNVLAQLSRVAALPGIVRAAYAMPDAHWGYGFPIGGVAAFEPEAGVVSAGGVGFDISCGVRTLLTDLDADDVVRARERLADALFHAVPAGVGSAGPLRLSDKEMDEMLDGGAQWAVARGYGNSEDLNRIEGRGRAEGAEPAEVSSEARRRQRDEMGTLGSGNHYLEVQKVAEIYNPAAAEAFGLRPGQALVSIHCGSRGLGHQVATDYSRRMVTASRSHGIALADRELACAPIASTDGQAYIGAMRAAINCALANRQILTQLIRETFQKIFGLVQLPLLYDVSHNTCSEERHEVDGHVRTLFVHRKGATRALAPGHPLLPPEFRATGQPVLVGGTMGTASYVLAGTPSGEHLSFGSACHGAGRRMSRKQALGRWHGRDVIKRLECRDILVRTASVRGVAEEAPDAYKDVEQVVDATQRAGLAVRVAALKPIICVKG